MKYNIKKLAFITLTALILLTGRVLAAETENDLSKEYKILSKMGIADITDTNTIVTRYNFLQYTMRLAGNPEGIFGKDGRQIFADVSPNSEYSGLISAAFDNGVIVGSDNGLFDGTSGITLEQAVIMICRALNYNLIQSNNAGYSFSSIKPYLINGVNCDEYDKLDGKNALKVLYNALETNTLKISNDGSISDSGNTVMGDIHSVGYIEGVVKSDFCGGIYGDAPQISDGLAIGDYEIRLPKEYQSKSYLGQKVKLYYKRNRDGSLDAVYIEPKNTTLLKINREDVISFAPLEFKYYNGNREQSAKIGVDTVTLLNGELKLITDGYKIPAAADVSLIDNNNDGTYEFIFINEFKKVYVSSVDAQSMKIYNQFSEIGTVDLNEYGNIIMKNTDVTEVSFEDIKHNDILKVYLYKNADRAVIELTRNTIGVEIKNLQQEKEGDFDVFRICDSNGKEYKTDIFFVKSKDTPQLVVGDYYNFALDDKGMIVAVNEHGVQSGYIYAYVYKSYISELDKDELIVELYTENGEFETYSVRKKVYCANEQSRISVDTLKSKIASSGMIRCQISDGIIKKIEFPSDDLSYDGMKLIGVSSITSSSNGENRYYSSVKNIGGQIAMKTDTKVIIIPPENERSNKDLYGMTSQSYFKSDNYYPGVVGYGSDKKAFFADVVLMNGVQGSSLDSQAMLVTQVSEEYSEATDSIRYSITGYESGRLKKYFLNIQLSPQYTVKSTGEIIPIETGDSIRINFDQNQEINYLKLMFDESEKKIYGVNDKNDDEVTYGNGGFHTWGTFYSKSDGCFRMIRDGSSEFSPDIYSTDSTTYIFEYDSSMKKDKQIRRITLDDIETFENVGEEADKAFVYMYKPPCSMIVVYK